MRPAWKFNFVERLPATKSTADSGDFITAEATLVRAVNAGGRLHQSGPLQPFMWSPRASAGASAPGIEALEGR